MSSVVSRVAIGLGVAVAALVAIGYAFIFSGIATPVARDLGTVAIPDEDGAVPVYLSDGRPAFVVRTTDRVMVVDARPPHRAGEPSSLAVWCNGVFADLVAGVAYAPDGTTIGAAPSGLILYPTRQTSDGLVVGSDGQPAAGLSAGDGSVCAVEDALTHRPEAGEVFDPSVAADEEPPGWIWMEGGLTAAGGQTLLCDSGDDCATGAVARGIDPAKLDTTAPLQGLFIGRIRDGAIDELYYVPQAEDGR